jgi:hypothetical protein
VAFTPINNCAAFCIALICLDLPGQAASPRLASFGLIAHRTGSPYSLAIEMRAVRISSSYQLPYTYTAPQNPCLTFNHHLSLFSVSALRPTSGVLISPPGSGTLVCLRLPLVNCLSKATLRPTSCGPTPLALRRSPASDSKFLLTRKQVCVMTLVERHSHRPHYPSMPYKYTPVSARLGPSPPPYPLTPLTSSFSFPFSFPSPYSSPCPLVPDLRRLSPWNDRNPDYVPCEPSFNITETPARANARPRGTYSTASAPFGAYHTASIIIFPFPARRPVPTATATSIFTAASLRPGQRPRLHRAVALVLVLVVGTTQSRSHL